MYTVLELTLQVVFHKIEKETKFKKKHNTKLFQRLKLERPPSEHPGLHNSLFMCHLHSQCNFCIIDYLIITL